MSSDKPLVSIIVNCYNGDRFLREAIDSIYKQSYSNWEIIFWDNASTDNSANIAKSYDNKLKYFFVNKTSSLGEARNLALQQASGIYISFLDCDDRYLPDKIQYQVELMEYTKCALCYGSVIVINEGGERIRCNAVTGKCGYLLNDLLISYEINMQSVMIRRHILVSDNLSFNTSLEFSPDYDLFMRIAVSHNLCSIDKYLVEYRKVSDSLTYRMLDHIAPEMKSTIDSIENSISYSSRSQASIDYALGVVEFYKSLPLIESGDYKGARKHVLKSIKSKKLYVLYYIMLFLPVPPRYILKIIMR